MTFCGGKMADGGFDTVGSGNGVDIWGREFDSLFPLSDFLSDFMAEDKFNCLYCHVHRYLPMNEARAGRHLPHHLSKQLFPTRRCYSRFTMAQRKLQSQLTRSFIQVIC